MIWYIYIFQSKSPVPATQRPPLMTRRQLTDPFGSDEEDEKYVFFFSSYRIHVPSKYHVLLPSNILWKCYFKHTFTPPLPRSSSFPFVCWVAVYHTFRHFIVLHPQYVFILNPCIMLLYQLYNNWKVCVQWFFVLPQL